MTKPMTEPHPSVDRQALVLAEQSIALLQRRLIRPMSRGGPKAELTLAQYHTVSFLAGRGQSNTAEIARTLGFARSTTSVLLEKLRRAGLVKKVPDSNDGRVMLISATPKGLRAVKGLRENAATSLRRLSDTAGEATVANLFDALEKAVVATDALDDN